MYKVMNNLHRIFSTVVYIGFGIPIIGLLKGKNDTDSLFHLNKNIYLMVSLTGIVIAALSIIICIVLRKRVKHMDSEIKSLSTYTAPVVKYNLFKSKYSVVFTIGDKKYEYKFETTRVKKVYDFKKGSFVSYKIYKGEVIPERFYLAIPKYEKGIKNKWNYLIQNG